jgi:hypothetical protein
MKKNTKILMFLGLIVLVILIVLNFQKHREVGVNEVKTEEKTISPYLNSDIQIKTFEGEKGWGYDITIDGVIYVHQPSVPALPGDEGFKTEAHAKAVAELMVQKIKDNILPPGVTEEEVKVLISQ